MGVAEHFSPQVYTHNPVMIRITNWLGVAA
jgi:hypothetical protein